MSRAPAAAATSAETSALTVLVSIRMDFGAIAATIPWGPSMTARNAASSGSEVMATVLPPTASVADPATEMPWPRAAASCVSLRSKAVTAYPALATSADIGKPILPSPIQAMVLEASVIVVLFPRLDV